MNTINTTGVIHKSLIKSETTPPTEQKKLKTIKCGLLICPSE